MKLAILGIILLCITVIIIGPLVLIWALNTLFLLGIPMNFWTWLSALILGASFASKGITVNR